MKHIEVPKDIFFRGYCFTGPYACGQCTNHCNRCNHCAGNCSHCAKNKVKS